MPSATKTDDERELEGLTLFPRAAVAGSRALGRGSRGLRALGARLRDSPRAPAFVLVGSTLLLGAAAAVVAVQVATFALDETLFKQSALHYYRDGFPNALFHDLNARGTARLYPLVLAPLMGAFDGDVAVRAGRALGAFLFASAAIPTYLLARSVLRSRWRAVAAGVLSVAVPWLTLGTTLFTENLAYPGFVWTVLAIRAAVRRPSPLRDGAALAAIALLTCVRVQFVAILPAYLVLIAAREARRARRRGQRGWDLPSAMTRGIRASPLSAALVAVVAAGVAVLIHRHQLHHEVQAVLGRYSDIQDRNSFPSQMGLAFLVEVVSLALGVGLVPAIAAGAWYRTVLSRRSRGSSARTFAVQTLWIVGAVWALALVAQGNYNGALTEERYYIYAVPLLWIGALAAMELRTIDARTLLVAGIGFALLFATIDLDVPLNGDTSFVAPASAGVGHLLHDLVGSVEDRLSLDSISPRDVLAAIALAIALAVAWVWHAAPRARVLAVVAVPALAQLGLTAYVFAATTGHVGAVRPRTGSHLERLAWVDRSPARDQRVVWLNNQPRGHPAAADVEQRTSLLWNSNIREIAFAPGLGLPMVDFPLSALPTTYFSVRLDDGRLSPGLTEPVVEVADSPFLQLAGSRIGASPDGRLELVAPASPARAKLVVAGLSLEGGVVAGRTARLRVYANSSVAIAFALPTRSAVRGSVSVRATGHASVVDLERARPTRVVSLTLCPGRRGSGVVALRSLHAPPAAQRSPSVVVTSVRLSPAAAGCTN